MPLTLLEISEETDDVFLVSALAAGVILNSMLTQTSPDLAWSRGYHALHRKDENNPIVDL